MGTREVGEGIPTSIANGQTCCSARQQAGAGQGASPRMEHFLGACNHLCYFLRLVQQKPGGTMRKKTKKPAFGGYAISFEGCSDTLESLFGSAPIGPSEMTKKIWTYVKRRGLAK